MQPLGKWISRECFDIATREYVVGEWDGEWPAGHGQASEIQVCLFIHEGHSLATWAAMKHDGVFPL